MNLRGLNVSGTITRIILVLSVGCVAQALWIPLPRSPNRISRLIYKARVQRPALEAASFGSPMKRDASMLTPMTNAAESLDVVDDESTEQQEATQDENPDIEDHWPITPRACLVLMKILYAQTAATVEQGNTDADFYEAASFFQPAIRTLFKCMDMADREITPID